jgi:hypothetical protein
MSDAVRSFGTFIAEVEDGELHADLSRQLQALIADFMRGAASDRCARSAGLPFRSTLYWPTAWSRCAPTS